jgi:hypothetical protein
MSSHFVDESSWSLKLLRVLNIIERLNKKISKKPGPIPSTVLDPAAICVRPASDMTVFINPFWVATFFKSILDLI